MSLCPSVCLNVCLSDCSLGWKNYWVLIYICSHPYICMFKEIFMMHVSGNFIRSCTKNRERRLRWKNRLGSLAYKATSPGARFSKLPVITGPVKLFCFPFQMGVSKLLKIIQLSYQLKKKVDFIRGQNTPYFS